MDFSSSHGHPLLGHETYTVREDHAHAPQNQSLVALAIARAE